MPLPLPDLDTRTFADLADEARASIPRYARPWTDHNLTDPGITATESVAAELDGLMYAVNRVTNRDRRTLLRLLGFGPLPPQPARTVLEFAPRGAAAVDVPAGVVLAGLRPGGDPVPFRTLAPVHVGPAMLVAVQTGDAGAFIDNSRTLAGEDGILALGVDPAAESASSLLLGLDPAPQPGATLSLWLEVESGAGAGRIEAELGSEARTVHHDASVAWEFHDATAWQPIADVEDATRALTVTGSVSLPIVAAPPLTVQGAVATPAAWIRCRLASGRLDAAPRLRGIAVNAVPAAQVLPATTRLVFAPACVVPAGQEPVAGSSQPLTLDVDADGLVTAIAADPALETPAVEILEYEAKTATKPGHVVAGLAVLGRGARTPGQRLELPCAPVVANTVSAWVARGTAAEPVRIVPSLDSSPSQGLAAVLDPATGTLVFGDGRHGRMLAEDELVLATYDRTRAADGNLRGRSSLQFAGVDDDANRLRLGGTAPADVDLALAVTAPWVAVGGADAEDVARAAGRASRRLFAHERLLELMQPGRPATLDGIDPSNLEGREAPERATNGADLERIALDAPGCRVARARTWPALDAAYPGLKADGAATVVILPELPAEQPQPSPGLLRAVRRIIERRRLVASRIVVAGPTYVEVRVRARLRAAVGREPASVVDAAQRALNRYLHPLTGGRNSRGWPFGRNVYRPEILGVLDAVDGVESVAELELLRTNGETCGNVCIPPTALVAAGTHEISVET